MTKRYCCRCKHYGLSGYCKLHKALIIDMTRGCSKFEYYDENHILTNLTDDKKGGEE